jgi:hypothetical protein
LAVASIIHRKEINEGAIRRRITWEEQPVIMLANWMKADPNMVVASSIHKKEINEGAIS